MACGDHVCAMPVNGVVTIGSARPSRTLKSGCAVVTAAISDSAMSGQIWAGPTGRPSASTATVTACPPRHSTACPATIVWPRAIAIVWDVIPTRSASRRRRARVIRVRYHARPTRESGRASQGQDCGMAMPAPWPRNEKARPCAGPGKQLFVVNRIRRRRFSPWQCLS